MVSVSRTTAHLKTTLKPSDCSGGVYLRAAHPEIRLPINGITAKDAGAMMALLKVARIATGSSPDSFVDLAGYAACAGEIATERPVE